LHLPMNQFQKNIILWSAQLTSSPHVQPLIFCASVLLYSVSVCVYECMIIFSNRVLYSIINEQSLLHEFCVHSCMKLNQIKFKVFTEL